MTRKIGTVSELRKRKTQAQRIQHAVDSTAEIARLQAHVGELLAGIRQRDLTIQALRRQIDDLECEEEGSGP
jgi:hypothetical protein